MPGDMTILLGLAIGGVVGALLAWLALRGGVARAAAAGAVERATLDERVRALSDEKAGLLADLASTGEILREHQAQTAIDKAALADLKARLEAERAQAQEKLALLSEARESLSNQFKTLANDILEEKSKKFTDQNQTNLGQLLEPLKLRINEFQGKVEQVYVQEGKDRSALAEQVRQLMELNQSLSKEAKNLTQALKGSSKTQGNWGELILERVLEQSGLRKGHEYDVQESHTREDGSRAQPDVVIRLPEGRNLVVDAKVSLLAYEEFALAESEDARAAAARRHIESVRNHIKGLSARNYQDLYGLKSLDFVLMFVPIEPAFMLAVTHERDLFMEAWDKSVLLVSPSTLLFVVRTVAHLWRQEAQSRNAQEIARRGGELYDRLAGFVADLEKVGNGIRSAQKSYDDAYAKLSTNKGNVIRQAEMLKTLGVKPSKSLPPAMVEVAIEPDGD
ncbi:DNA recombination protein RmuC [Zavarzinia compransoris]|uniref:DNA recombination protein RmuC n=1 Tax=Zavarzinia marina TaxID=2911065 RepID=UPI001F3DF93C|nr:DNA recombination protein RmuC [Zavarzinia marina]MCF4165334.1 DNA recombination protein RmuC [Zavarzinia marina]